LQIFEVVLIDLCARSFFSTWMMGTENRQWEMTKKLIIVYCYFCCLTDSPSSSFERGINDYSHRKEPVNGNLLFKGTGNIIRIISRRNYLGAVNRNQNNVYITSFISPSHIYAF